MGTLIESHGIIDHHHRFHKPHSLLKERLSRKRGILSIIFLKHILDVSLLG